MITPEILAKSGTEDAHQKALMCWCQLNAGKRPELAWLFHIPNGGSRHIAEAGKLKAMGVRRGVPDLFLPVQNYNRSADSGYIGLFIELKKIGGKVPPEQLIWIEYLNNQGYKAVVCYGWEEARDVIEEYLK